MQGIDLSKTKDRHSSLKNIREVLLSDNNLSNIAFLQNYKDTLVQLKIYNNLIKDITNLSGLSLRNLELCGLPLYDISPLKDVAGLEKLKLENITARDFSGQRFFLLVYYSRSKIALIFRISSIAVGLKS